MVALDIGIALGVYCAVAFGTVFDRGIWLSYGLSKKSKRNSPLEEHWKHDMRVRASTTGFSTRLACDHGTSRTHEHFRIECNLVVAAAAENVVSFGGYGCQISDRFPGTCSITLEIPAIPFCFAHD